METFTTNTSHSEDGLRLKAIFETATDGIIIIDDRGIMELVNSSGALLFGYEVDELIGQNVSILMPMPYQREHDAYIQDYNRTGIGKIIGIGREVEGLKKDGSIFPLRLSISEVQLPNRKIFTGIVHDLSEQKSVEKALKKEKERAQQYLDVANTIIVVINAQQEITLLNKKGYELLGYREGELYLKNWFDVAILPQNKERVLSYFKKILSGEAQTDYADYFENEVITKSGEIRLMAWRNATIRDEHGQIIATISSGVDITEQRAAETSLKELNTQLEERVDERTEELAEAVNQLLNTNKQLEYEIQERKTIEGALRKNENELRHAYEREKELSELKSRFVSMASHEFRTPLSTILSSADLIEAYKREDQQTKRERHTNRIKSSVANLTSILNDFLSLSKLEEGGIEEHPVSFDLNDFCIDVLDQMQGLLKTDQHIRHDMLVDPPNVILDKKLLKNIFINLMSNAIKYSGAGSVIDCRILRQEKTLIVVIADQGIGIPEEEQQHLFTQFFRARNVENIQGTGLGLNIVKRYVELMKGNISFESKLGVGTTISVYIPLDKVEYPEE